jgi:hypothetical protein
MENRLDNRAAPAGATRSEQSQERAAQAIRDAKPANRTENQPEGAEAQNESVARELSHDAPTIAGTAAPAGGVPDEKELQRQRLREQARNKRDNALNADAVTAGKLSEEAAALEKQAEEI